MDQISRVLEENGSIVIGVPAYQSLCNHDIVLKHLEDMIKNFMKSVNLMKLLKDMG